jgi:NTE family protein
VGVIHVLEQEKVPVDLIVGTSVGSLIGALYADLADAFELEAIAWQIERSDLFDFSLIGIGRGPFAGQAIEAFVREHIRATRFEELRRPFVAVATDLVTGQEVVLDRGPLAPAIHASSAIPGIYRPVLLEGKTLVDGGVVNPIPVSVARDRAASVVIAVDVSRELPAEEPGNVYSIWMRSLTILTREMARLKSQGADVLIEPKVGDTSPFDFTKKKELMAAGVQAAREAMPAIRAALAAKLGPSRTGSF